MILFIQHQLMRAVNTYNLHVLLLRVMSLGISLTSIRDCVSCIGLYWFVYRVLVCIDCFIADSLILFILQYLLGELFSWNLIK